MRVRTTVAAVLSAWMVAALAGCQAQMPTSGISDADIKKLTEQIAIQFGKDFAAKKDLDQVQAQHSLLDAKVTAIVNSVADARIELGDLTVRTQQKLPAELAQVKSDLGKATDRLTAAETELRVRDTRIADIERRLAKTEGDVLAQTDTIDANRSDLKQVVRRDSKQNLVLALGQINDRSEEFRQEFKRAVREAVEVPQPAWGTIRVTNNMGAGQFLRVNAVEHWIAPYSSLDLTVPAGWATTELVGYEATKSWWVGAPSFFQRVTIGPRAGDLVWVW